MPQIDGGRHVDATGPSNPVDSSPNDEPWTVRKAMTKKKRYKNKNKKGRSVSADHHGEATNTPDAQVTDAILAPGNTLINGQASSYISDHQRSTLFDQPGQMNFKQKFESWTSRSVSPITAHRIREQSGDNVEKAMDMYFDGALDIKPHSTNEDCDMPGDATDAHGGCAAATGPAAVDAIRTGKTIVNSVTTAPQHGEKKPAVPAVPAYIPTTVLTKYRSPAPKKLDLPLVSASSNEDQEGDLLGESNEVEKATYKAVPIPKESHKGIGRKEMEVEELTDIATIAQLVLKQDPNATTRKEAEDTTLPDILKVSQTANESQYLAESAHPPAQSANARKNKNKKKKSKSKSKQAQPQPMKAVDLEPPEMPRSGKSYPVSSFSSISNESQVQ